MTPDDPFDRGIEPPARLTPEQHARLTQEERASLPPDTCDRLAVLEDRQDRGRCPTLELDEVWVIQRLGHVLYLLSVGQRVWVGKVDQTARLRIWDRYGAWQIALEETIQPLPFDEWPPGLGKLLDDGVVDRADLVALAKRQSVDWQLTELGVSIGRGDVGRGDLARLGQLKAELVGQLGAVLDEAARPTTTAKQDTPAVSPAERPTDASVIDVPVVDDDGTSIAKTPGGPPTLSTAAERRAAVDAFLTAANKSGLFKGTLRRTHVWRAMGYKDARPFELWQAAKPLASEECDRLCRDLLHDGPEPFIATVKKKSLV